jgi:ABC-2 type transport system permease protein
MVSTQSNVIPESPAQSQGIPATVIPAARLVYWSVRREFWENRAFYVAPAAVAAVFLLGFLISILHVLLEAHASPWLDPIQQRDLFGQPYEFVENLIMASTLFVGMFYSADALYGERRDRSVLLWKSLPVSDLTTVLSKASIPILILPLITFGITLLTQSIMLVMSGIVLLINGQSISTIWSILPVFQMWMMLLFHLLGIHGLWGSPIYAWLLMVSSWVRRAPLLWAILPPLALGFAEKAAFRTTHLGDLILSRFTGGLEGSAIMAHRMSMNPSILLAPAHFLLNPGLWMGFAVTAAFLTVAIYVRRYRAPV